MSFDSLASKLTRRQFAGLAAVAAVAAPLALAGCSAGNTDDQKTAADADKPAEGDQAADEPETAESGYTLLTDGKLTIASSPDYPPFENMTPDGEGYEGYEIDLMNAIADKLGLELVVKPLQFDAIIPAIVAGGTADVGVSGFSVDPDRAKEIDFTDAIYTDDMAVIVNTAGDITEENVKEALNSSGMTIAAQSGTTGEVFAKENFPEAEVKGYGNANDTFAALQAEQVQAVCTNYAVGVYAIQSYPEEEVVMRVTTGEDYAFVVSQDNPGLTAALNEAIAELKEDGTLDELLKAWNLA